jgi:CheY-like chemotaxis protein
MDPTRVLVVEDEAVVALNLKQQLTKLGYEVSKIVASGEQALLQAAALRPDLILMDIKFRAILTASKPPASCGTNFTYRLSISQPMPKKKPWNGHEPRNRTDIW